MRLRKLELKDAPFMLEWMHDEFVVKDMQTDFSTKKLEDCTNFIVSSTNNPAGVDLAIVNEDDEYMGTVSLKHMDNKLKIAEFAITIRKVAMSKGYAQFAMDKIIHMAFDELDMNVVYWYVSASNARALRFYDKYQYSRVPIDTIDFLNTREDYSYLKSQPYVWYCKRR